MCLSFDIELRFLRRHRAGLQTGCGQGLDPHTYSAKPADREKHLPERGKCKSGYGDCVQAGPYPASFFGQLCIGTVNTFGAVCSPRSALRKAPSCCLNASCDRSIPSRLTDTVDMPHILFIRSMYSVPQVFMTSKTGWNFFPISVRKYSTTGGLDSY